MARVYVNITRGRIPDLIALLPKDGSWLSNDQISILMGLAPIQVGRVANMAKNSVMRCIDPETGRPAFRLVPALCDRGGL